MTKVVKFCNTECVKKEKKLKPIKLTRYINIDTSTPRKKAKDYGFIALVIPEAENTISRDLIVCWDDPKNKYLYLGHWNDGVA